MNPNTNTLTDSLLQLSLDELIRQANQVRKEFLGNRIELCSIINAKSGLCSEDCRFCAQSLRYCADIAVFPLKHKHQLVQAAERARGIGAQRFGIVTSGNRPGPDEIKVIAEAVHEIAAGLNIKVCASLGALEGQALRLLKQAGLSRYHHNIETSRNFYPEVVSTHTFEQRIDTIQTAKQIGLEVCSGGIIGLGEAWQDRIEMAQLLRDLNVDAVPINFLVPIKGTPLQDKAPLACTDAIKTIAIFRIILKDKVIKIAAGRETVLKASPESGFMAGANGMIIGGYLTVKGAEVEADHQLVKQVERLWQE